MNFNQLHWVPQETKQAMSDLRAEASRIAELKVELQDFRDIFWSSNDHNTKSWAKLQIKSIEHELDQLGASC